MTLASEELGYIEATLTLRRTEDGGRRAAIRSGYRPNWWLPGEAGNAWAGGTVALVGVDELDPGETGKIRIYPFAPDDWTGTTIGSILEMCEGPVLIGKAAVTHVRLPIPIEAS